MKKIVLCLVCFVLLLQGQTISERRGSEIGKVGIYFWGDFPQINSHDPFGEASRDILALGAKVARTAMTPYWSALEPAPDLAPLDRKVYKAEYIGFISSFEEAMLTVYDSASYDKSIADQRYRHRERYTDDEWRVYLEEVFQEYARFGERLVELSARFGTKITVSNWEAANDAPKDHFWYLEDGQEGPYLEYLKSRLSGLRQGIATGLERGLQGRVETAFEFTLLWQGMDTSPWDNIPARQISDFEIGVRELKELVDLWSYSAWASVFHIPDAKISAEYNRQSLETAFRRMRQVCPDCRIMIGELGYLYDQEESGAVLPVLYQTALQQGAETVFSWVLYDQPQERWSAFGAYNLEGKITEQGIFLHQIMAVENIRERRGTVPRPGPVGKAR